ncbi:hypothetical protein B0H16DRAFT_1407103 [Mycena metata]|uniref:C2 domain-containing protein n=1 Tax=Mycena metata TaxID=1033252 RepID=A0AAD7K3I9_9AGAR|nr:hypothetical protein B0H16DRAFT_1407103 [Mycena metata]
MPSTYTLQITFDRAKNLPVADIGTLSCDPYILASLEVPDAEPLKFRTPTIRRNRDPTWNATWFVAGIPASGFKLKMILYDEDPGVKLSNDRLGKAVAEFGPQDMKEGFTSLETEYVLQKRKGDLHPYILTYLTALLPGEKLVKHNRVIASVRVLRKDSEQTEGRMYTLGPNKYSRHFSPLIGSMVNKATPKDANDSDGQKDGKGGKLSATTFIANKLQLTGPVPRELRHRFVGYRPFIKWMFDDSGIRGRILYHGLRKQYRTIYKCDKATVWGVIDDAGTNTDNSATPEGVEIKETKETREGGVLRDATPESAAALARQFLDMTAWGDGAKLFTYVMTLDGEWRFTETGPEFAIDLLSKHSMHADLAKEIAYSGEFFVQPLNAAAKEEQKREADEAGEKKPEERQAQDSQEDKQAEQSKPPAEQPSRDPKAYELIIDNDSGTYRPKKELLPILEKWLSDQRRLGGLGNVRAMDGFDEELKGMKEDRADRKAKLTGVPRKGKKDGEKKDGGGDKGKDKAGDKDEPTGKLVPVPGGSSASSISSGLVGRESVSSEEVQEALNKAEAPNGKTENPEGQVNGKTNNPEGQS